MTAENMQFVLGLLSIFLFALGYWLGYKAGYWTRKQEEIR